MKVRLGERPFLSVQGEGSRTCALTLFVRFFGCNLQCKGMFQLDPSDPCSYKDPLEGINIIEIKSVEDFPVVKYGCDTIYGIDPRFKHLATDYESVPALINELDTFLPVADDCTDWFFPQTGNEIDLCFTGGETMLNQKAIVDIDVQLSKRYVRGPRIIQIESNGTKPIQNVFENHFKFISDRKIHWNISPKLFNVTGEKDAWNPKVIASYFHLSHKGCLKFVVNNREETWVELNQKVQELREEGIGDVPIMIMGVGATSQQQEDPTHIKPIAERAIREGYHISGRMHVILFGNGVGT